MIMSIAFRDFFQRLCSVTHIRNQMDLARALGLNRSAITQAKTRDSVPQKWVLALARKYTLSPDWLEFGTGEARPGLHGTSPASFPPDRASLREAVRRLEDTAPPATLAPSVYAGSQEDVMYIPKAAARLCAGGGSFEVDAEPVDHLPMPRAWLNSLGRPSAMVFMDVVGDSMEPGICDGDMVLIDRSNRFYGAASIMAVGFDDAIYLKRVKQEGRGLVMISDNPAYGPVPLHGDELSSFHVIGKMVWLCRRFR